MKQFKDLKVGDELFKIHYDFEHNNSGIETKIIKEIHEPVSKFDKTRFVLLVFEGSSSLIDWTSHAKLYLDVDQQKYFECHQLSVSSHEIPDGENVYYAINKDDAMHILKTEMERYINSLSYKKKDLDKKLRKFRKYYKKFEQII